MLEAERDTGRRFSQNSSSQCQVRLRECMRAGRAAKKVRTVCSGSRLRHRRLGIRAVEAAEAAELLKLGCSKAAHELCG